MDFLLYAASLEASDATRSKMSDGMMSDMVGKGRQAGQNLPLTKELRMDMARLEIPVSGWTCFKTRIRGDASVDRSQRMRRGSVSSCDKCREDVAFTFVDVGGVSLLSGLGALLLLARGGCGLLASLLLLGRGFAGRGFPASGGGLGSGFWCHCDGS